MRLLFVVQRYGDEVLGGAELATREYAQRLSDRGHQVDVLTSRAVSYVDWADHYAEGTTSEHGVTVHRLPIRAPRDRRFFDPLQERVVASGRRVAYPIQKAWMQAQGPDLRGLTEWLQTHADSFDVVVFFTYLYAHTWNGVPAVAGLSPVVLHPMAHDEPSLRLGIFDPIFKLVDGFAYLTEEEHSLVARRFGIHPTSVLTGIGIDFDAVSTPTTDVESFRNRFGLGDAPYLLYAGRVDESKGAIELALAYSAFVSRHSNAPHLVLLGEVVSPVPLTEGLFVIGAVDEATKHAALEGCLALIQPSYYESFSIVLCEAWAHSKPAIVQGGCAVLAGQARRAGGALPYLGYAEFEAAIELVTEDAALRERLGNSGRRYVERQYQWDAILDRYELFLTEVVGTWSRGRPSDRRNSRV